MHPVPAGPQDSPCRTAGQGGVWAPGGPSRSARIRRQLAPEGRGGRGGTHRGGGRPGGRRPHVPQEQRPSRVDTQLSGSGTRPGGDHTGGTWGCPAPACALRQAWLPPGAEPTVMVGVGSRAAAPRAPGAHGLCRGPPPPGCSAGCPSHVVWPPWGVGPWASRTHLPAPFGEAKRCGMPDSDRSQRARPFWAVVRPGHQDPRCSRGESPVPTSPWGGAPEGAQLHPLDHPSTSSGPWSQTVRVGGRAALAGVRGGVLGAHQQASSPPVQFSALPTCSPSSRRRVLTPLLPEPKGGDTAPLVPIATRPVLCSPWATAGRGFCSPRLLSSLGPALAIPPARLCPKLC